MKKYIFIAFFICCAIKCCSQKIQIFPNQNVILNYTQVLFRFNEVENTSFYKVNVFDLNKQSNNSANLLYSKIDSCTSICIDNLNFDSKYAWNVEAYGANKNLIYKSENVTFYTMPCDYSDTTKYIIKQNYNKRNPNSTELFWCDVLHCAINNKGKVVWQFPKINEYYSQMRSMRDLRLLNNGYVSYFNDTNAYIIDLDLNVKWYAPKKLSGDLKNMARYHHSLFVDDTNNIYTMGLNYKKVFNKTNVKDTLENFIEENCIIKFDYNGNVKWSWIYSKNFFDSTYYKSLNDSVKFLYSNPHLNSLYLDSGKKYIYVSSRNLSRILKIDLNTKKVVMQFGSMLNENDRAVKNNAIFKFQHDFSISNNIGVVLNNNSNLKNIKVTTRSCNSSALFFKIPVSVNDSCVKLVSYNLNIDTLSNNCSTHQGNVVLLPDNNVLVCGGANARAYIFNKNNEILWDVIFKANLNEKNQFFLPFPQYKISYATSLYPYHFTVNKINNQIKLINAGSNTDSYTITINYKHKKISKHVTLSPHSHFVLIEKKLPASPISISVISSANGKSINYKL